MRRYDSGWRDSRLPAMHESLGLPTPFPGMSLPMVEYDRGEALAVINYVRRDATLPWGPEPVRAFGALGRLRSPVGAGLPFLTAGYDPRNWAMQLFAHNGPARALLGTDRWTDVTERSFARLLYLLRGHALPDLEAYGVTFSTAPWLEYGGGMLPVSWPGQDMSVRRRAYEPVGHRVPLSLRNPCTDIDLAVLGSCGEVTLLVDYKLDCAVVDTEHPTHRAMSGIRGPEGTPVPSMIVRYNPAGDRWTFKVFCLNREAEELLSPVMTRTVSLGDEWCPDGWAPMGEHTWFDVLDAARNR